MHYRRDLHEGHGLLVWEHGDTKTPAPQQRDGRSHKEQPTRPAYPPGTPVGKKHPMDAVRITAHTARKPHTCEGCGHRIQPGHRYLSHVIFPGHDALTVDRPTRLRQCISCAVKYDDSAVILNGACGTYCCGIAPCSLPLQAVGTTAHDHKCRECAGRRSA